MDESLDNYISKANFKVKVGNPRFNPNTGGFQGKKKFGGYQVNKVSDVSITVPAVQKTSVNRNSTNQIRDARDRLVSKTKPLDARNKLNQKARNTDARQKLMTIRAQKEPVDARAKIQAKKQQQTPGGTNTQTGPFTLTRTVANTKGNSVQVKTGGQGNVSITKTLTKVMPPGYGDILGASSQTAKPQITTKTSNVMKRLGTPAGQQSSIPNITRTISNPHDQSTYDSQTQTGYKSPTAPQTHHLPYPPTQHQAPGVPFQQHAMNPLPPTNVPPYPVHPHVPPVPTQYAPPPQQTLPYPAQDPVIKHEFQPRGQEHFQHIGQDIPKIQVQNDQYRPPEPQYPHYAAPPQPAYAPPPAQQYVYPQPSQPTYYPPTPQVAPERYEVPREIYHPPQEIYRPPPAVSQSSSSGSAFVKTIVNDQLPQRYSKTESSPLKRKSFGGEDESSVSSGPLRSSATNYIPVIETTGNVSRIQKPKLTKVTAPGEPIIKRLKPATDDDENVISPLQGYKVSITNLASSVTQDDIIELFGAVGAVKSVKVVKNGTAEVLYVKKEAAIEATKTYHDRELDGLPMVVKLVTPASARIREAPEKLPPSVKPAATGPLEFSKKTSAGKPRSSQKGEVDVSTLHKALFKTGGPGPSKPVTFTVNI